MKTNKSLYKSLTTISRSKKRNAEPVYQMRRGIDAKLNEFHPLLDDWGFYYQSILRTAVNDMQSGSSKEEIRATYQSRFNIEHVWTDTIAIESERIIGLTKGAKENHIESIEEDLKGGYLRIREEIKSIESAIQNPTRSNTKNIERKIHNLKERLRGLEKRKNKLEKIKKSDRLSICFGLKKLFNAQHHLEKNGYANHAEWLEDWRKHRSGNFYVIGRGDAIGGNRACPVRYIEEDLFSITIRVPYFLRNDHGNEVSFTFNVTGQRKHDLLYALESGKPITVQVFRREHKDDQWYIHLLTYVQPTPRISTGKNGCIGIDLNVDSIDLIYIKRDGNPLSQNGKFILFSFPVPQGAEGQKDAALRDIVADIVRVAEVYECPIAVENLDFGRERSRSRHSGSKRLNGLRGNFAYNKFRAFLVARAEKRGIEIRFVNAAFSSVIALLKYMPRYGLNSGSAAAMVIARRALGFKEVVPQAWFNALSRPEDQNRASWRLWSKVSSSIREHHIKRHQLFEPAKILEGIISSKSCKRKGKQNAPSLPVGVRARIQNKLESPMPTIPKHSLIYEQLSLGF